MSVDLMAPAAPPGLLRARLADPLLLRVNPMPGRRLAAPTLTAALRALAEAERRMTELAGPAGDELYALAGSATGPARHRALALRRDIHNHRDPVPALLDEAWPDAVSGWIGAQQQRLLACAAIASGYEELLARERAVLAEVCGSEHFRMALALNSPQVLDAVRRYRSGFAAPTARLAKSERGVVQHVTRAMARTSPLSRLTAVGFGSWSQGPGARRLDGVGFDRSAARAHLSLDRVLFSSVVTGALEAAGAVPGLPATVDRNRTLQESDSEVRFVRRADGTVSRVSAPLTRPLTVLLSLAAFGPVETSPLAAQLARRMGWSPAEVVRFLRSALDAQILRPGPAVPESGDDPLGTAGALLAQAAPAAAAVLPQVERALAEAAGPVGSRVAALGRLAEAEAELNALSERPARLHVNEDLFLPPVEVGAEGYVEALADLGEVAGFLSVFDRHLEVRALLTTAFTDRFGAGAEVDLLEAAPDLVAMVYRREAALDRSRAADFGPPDGSLEQLLALRSEALDHVLRGCAGDADEAVLDPAALAGFAARLPGFFRRVPGSYALLVQPADGRLVLNDTYGGRGLLGARFLGLDRDAGGDAADRVRERLLRQFGADGARVLEDTGLHGSNINHHLPLLSDTVGPQDWAGMRIAHDPQSGTLRLLDAEGRVVRPVNCGMKWAELLPAPLRLATWLADSGRVTVDFAGLLRARGLRAGADPQVTARLPRITAGRVVMHRARWYPGADFPGAGAGGDAERLIALTAWRARHGVPDEVFFKTPLSGLPSRQGEESVKDFVASRRRDKPQYADLGSALMTRVLPRLLQRRGAGYVEEALPGVRAGRHATEWAVEFDLPAAGAGGGEGR